MAELTSKQRDNLKPEDFALPGKRYPIQDESHARAALSRIAQFGTRSEQATVTRKVKARYPKIDVGGAMSQKSTPNE